MLTCLVPLFVMLALSGAAFASVQHWPQSWPSQLSEPVVRGRFAVVGVTNRLLRWFRPRHGDPLDSVQLHVRQTYSRLRRWSSSPANRLTIQVTAGYLVALAIGIVGLYMPAGSLLQRASMPILTISTGIFLFDTVYRKRSAINEKQRIIRTIGSRDNHVALDAAKAVIEKQWHKDGSLQNVSFECADLHGLSMARSQLSGAVFTYANLGNSELMFSDFEGARFGNCNLRGANLSFSNLDNASYGLADLEDASLGRCSMRDAHLESANLRNTFLDDADLDSASLDQAIYNAKTHWPDGFTPPDTAINWDTLSDTERAWFRQWRWYLNDLDG